MRFRVRNRFDITNRRGHADGFTMVEILVSLLLASISMVGLTAIQIQTIRQTTIAKRSTEATRLAQMVIDRYKSTSFANLPAPLNPVEWERELWNTTEMTRVGSNGMGDGPYTVDRLIEAIGTRRVITVRVSWQSTNPQAGNATQSVVFTTQRMQ